MKESAVEPQKIRRKNSLSEVIGRCDNGIGASIRENEEKYMIIGEVEAVDRKQKSETVIRAWIYQNWRSSLPKS